MSSKIPPSWAQLQLRRCLHAFVRSAEMKHLELCIKNDTNTPCTKGFRYKFLPGMEDEDAGEEENEIELLKSSNGKLHDEIALGKSLNACAMRKDLHDGARLHAAIIKLGLLEKNVFIGSILVNMYAKCGALEKGHHVFTELPVRNVVSWNGLIGGYAQHGHSEKALSCFRCMQQEGLSPDAVTCTCILKACSSMGAAEKGQEIHAEIVKNGLLERDVVLGNASVDMYAKSGALAKAHQVLEELPIRNVVSWTVLILGYCQYGHGEDALNCFEQMKEEGLSADAVTFSCVLKACGIVGTIEKGREVHSGILRRGWFETSTVIGNSLVDMYAKCGALAKARQIFDELSVRDSISWNVLIGGYSEQGLGEEALNCYELMNHDALSPDEVTFACVLKACSSIGAIEKGKEIHAEVMRQGLLGKDSKLGNALVDMYAKCGALAKAQQVFKELQVQDVVSWTALIIGFCHNGHSMHALDLFEKLKREGILLDVVALIGILKAGSSIGIANIGEGLHAEIVKRDLLGDRVVLGNALVDMYAKCGMLGKAQQVFEELPIQDVMSWNALIVGFCQQGHSERAISCHERMHFEGFSPDPMTFACVLKACGTIGVAEKGQEIHAEIARKGLLYSGTVLGNALVNTYIRCGLPAMARNVFEELPCQNVVSWNSIITGYCQHEHSEEAVTCFDRMEHEGVSPDAITFACVLKACGSIGAAEKGKEIHVDIIKKGFLESNPVVGSALVDMYAKCGALPKAREVFDRLPTQDLVSWTALIGGYCEHGHGEEALESYEQMKYAGHSPDAVTFACILKACSSLGASDKGQMHFETISRRYGIFPTLEHHTSMVDLLGRAGHFDEAMALIDKLPTSEYLPTWVALLGACRKLGNVKLGKLAFEQRVQVDGKHHNVTPC